MEELQSKIFLKFSRNVLIINFSDTDSIHVTSNPWLEYVLD